MGSVGRAFLAVSLPDEATATLAAALTEWTGGKPLPGKPVPPSNWHLTLRFLGAIDEVTFDRLCAGLDQRDLGGSFEVSLSGLGAFPNPRRAAVLWVGVHRGVERMTELAAVVGEATVEAGMEPEDRPFHSHLTLSRIRPDQDLRPLLERPAPPAVSFAVDAVTLFQSHLGGGPARYEPLERFPLMAPR